MERTKNSAKSIITLGSLFDGISAFPLAAQGQGIKTKWTSEIERFPISVSAKRFPDAKQLGDITKINGAEIEPVDIITFGSPCQDLSVAGKQKGLLQGLKVKQKRKRRIRVSQNIHLIRKFFTTTRSGLILEAIRIIREMQEATNGEYPTFAIWENVTGAFSSNGGADFSLVLSKLVGGEILLPANKKWSRAGVASGPLGQVAWRTFDAQFWGVPQRRRRIKVVADFRGERAGEVLFEQSRLPRDSAESGETREEVASGAGGGVKEASRIFYESGPGWISEGVGCLRAEGENRPSRPAHTVIEPACYPEVAGTLCASGAGLSRPAGMGSETDLVACQPTMDVSPTYAFSAGQSVKAGSTGFGEEISPTLRSGQSGTNMVPTIILADQGGSRMDVSKDVVPTLRAESHNHEPIIIQPLAFNGRQDPVSGDISGALDSTLPQSQCIAYPDPANTLLGKSKMSFRDDMDNVIVSAVDARNLNEVPELSGTLQAKEGSGYSLNYQNPVRIGYRVRRFTPLECLRLMGLPDDWLDIEGTSDSAKYKAIGNSIAKPPLDFIFEQMVKVMKRDKEMDWEEIRTEAM